MSPIIDFILSSGLNKSFFGKKLYPETNPKYRLSMINQFYHKLYGDGNRKFSVGELKRLETIIDTWVGDLIEKYKAIKECTDTR